MSGIEHIKAERQRQLDEEGWTPGHDDRYASEELPRAAICYALPPYARHETPVKLGALGEGWESCSIREAEHFLPEYWPWDPTWWKPSGSSGPAGRIRELTKAGALIAAEIDRLERGAP